MDKQKQIEEMAKVLDGDCGECYTVRKSTIVVNNRKKAVLEAYKEGGNAKNE
jgi:hypothetical protein